MNKILKYIFLPLFGILIAWLVLDIIILTAKSQDLNSGYNIPHFYSESYVELDERYRNDTVLTNALALAPDDVTIGMTGGKWTISNDMTIAANKHLFFDCDTYLYIETNVTLTVNGSIDSAGLCKIFDGPGTIDGDIINDCLVREWFGDDLIVGFDEPYCDEYATTNWVIWYVGDHFTNSIQPWVTNWVTDYVTNYVDGVTSNFASLVENNYFIDGVTNNMEWLIVRSNLTVNTINNYDVDDFISEDIFYGFSTNTVPIVGPVTLIDDYSEEKYDFYNSFDLVTGIFTPPKNGRYLIGSSVIIDLPGAATYNLDLFFDIDAKGSNNEDGYQSTSDDSSLMGIGYVNQYILTTNSTVQVAIFEEVAAAYDVVKTWFWAIYKGEN